MLHTFRENIIFPALPLFPPPPLDGDVDNDDEGGMYSISSSAAFIVDVCSVVGCKPCIPAVAVLLVAVGRTNGDVEDGIIASPSLLTVKKKHEILFHNK